MDSPYQIVPKKPELASRTERLLASVIDSVFLTGVLYLGAFFGQVLATAFAKTQQVSPEQVRNAVELGALFGALFWFYAVWFLNFVVLQGMTGSSVGKSVLRIRVVSEGGAPFGVWKSFLRSLSYFISVFPAYLGLASILVSRRNQCWHDLICRTLVIKRDAVSRSSGDSSLGEEGQRAA